MKRLLALAVVAGAAALAAPAAQAVPNCGALAGVNCFNGARVCRVWVAATKTCV